MYICRTPRDFSFKWSSVSYSLEIVVITRYDHTQTPNKPFPLSILLEYLQAPQSCQMRLQPHTLYSYCLGQFFVWEYTYTTTPKHKYTLSSVHMEGSSNPWWNISKHHKPKMYLQLHTLSNYLVHIKILTFTVVWRTSTSLVVSIVS